MFAPALPAHTVQRVLALSVLLGLLAMLAAPVLPSRVTAAGSEETVDISTVLEPARLEIAAGTTVTWHNGDGERHRMRSEEGPERFDSGNLESGESFSYTFSLEGSYPYFDHRDRDNAAYFGMIVVGGTSAAVDGPLPARGSISIIDKSFRPLSFSIATGGAVEWSNDDGEAHTVTSTDSLFDSGVMSGGATFSETFYEPGDYPYFCLIHPEMRGTISVAETVDEPPPDEPVSVESDLAELVPAPDPDTALGALTGEGTTVSTIDRAFQPDDVEVSAGESVLWTNDDTEGHTVTAVDGAFNSGVMTVSDEFSVTFETVGTFDYFCAIHPEMTGTVNVLEPAG